MTNHPNRKLTPKLREMLERIGRVTAKGDALLELSLVAAGGRAHSQLQTLLVEEWAERCDHPTVKAGNYAARAVRITDAGRAALGGY